MEKIYSRKKINISKVNKYIKNRNLKKFFTIFLVLSVMFSVMFRMIKSINSMIEEQGIIKAKSIATIVTNEESTNVMARYEYLDLSTIQRDADGNVTTISANPITINKIISDIPVEIDNRLNSGQYSEFKLRLGTIFGIKMFAGWGPSVKIKIANMGTLDTGLVSEFSAVGINQTLHRIFLQIDTKVAILTPYNSIEETISNQVLLAETVIVGKIPQTYYNLEGMTQDDVMEVME
ncbi:MAG: sporulation protein YunB [Clostridia bacterium]|nr:sporulation protein YunB [Clostridia bacterium]